MASLAQRLESGPGPGVRLHSVDVMDLGGQLPASTERLLEQDPPAQDLPPLGGIDEVASPALLLGAPAEAGMMKAAPPVVGDAGTAGLEADTG